MPADYSARLDYYEGVSETRLFGLSARERVESILPRFEISVIERYFPEYAEEIRQRLP